MKTLKKLLDKFNEYDLVNHVQVVYPDTTPEIAVGYFDVIEILKKLTPRETNMTLHIKYVDYDNIMEEAYPEDECYWDVHGKNTEEPDTTWALELSDWEEWLGYPMEYPKELSDLDAAVHCLWEMTFMGWDPNAIKAVKDDLYDRVNDIKEGKVDGKSYDSLDDFIKEIEEQKDELKKDIEDVKKEIKG